MVAPVVSHQPMVPVHLRDLLLGEEFTTAITRRRGRVIAWGHMRPPGYWSRRDGEPRPRWPAVLCWVGGQEMRLSPEIVVLVGRDRIHWRTSDASASRWAKTLPGLSREELEEQA